MKSKLLAILGLGLAASLNLNAQDSEKRDSIYNNKGQLEREIIEKGNGEDTIDYKYDKKGFLIEEFIKSRREGHNEEKKRIYKDGLLIEEIRRYFDPDGDYMEKTYKYDENGFRISEFWQIDENKDGKFDKNRIYSYEKKEGSTKEKEQIDNDGDGIYEEQREGECTCEEKKEAI